MSKATSTDTGSQQKPASSNVSTPSGSGTVTPSAPPAFNYAAAAAKSKAAAAAAAAAASAALPNTTSTSSASPQSGSTPSTPPTPASNPSIASIVANGKSAPTAKPASSTPATSSSLNPATKGSAATAAAAPGVNGTSSAGHSRRQSAVSMPKATPGPGRAGSTINFGDQNATLSSSPAAQPSLGQHLQGGQPKVFGSLAAEKDVAATKEKLTVGKESSTSPSATATSAAPAPTKKVDFHKLFQKQAPAAESSAAPSAITSPSLPLSSAQSPAVPAATTQRQPVAPSTPAGVRPPPSNLRTPSGQIPGRYESAQRSPSQQHHSVTAPQGQRLPSSGAPPYQQHQQRGPQQARSPHVANANVPMQQMGNPQLWHGGAQGMQFYPHPYSPYGHPQQAWPPQAMPGQPPYDGQNTPRSPRHANMQTMPGPLAQQSPMSATSAIAPGASPSSSFSTPSRPGPTLSAGPVGGSINSPSQQHSLGLGQPGQSRTFSPTAPTFTHSPSHSQSFSVSGSNLTANARSFQPKPRSSAIRIVNPETLTDISIPPAPQTASPINRQASLTVPSPRPSTPSSDATTGVETASTSVSRSSTPSTAAAPSSVQAQFLANVRAKANASEAKQKAEEKEVAERAENEAKEQAELLAKEKKEREAKEQAEREAKEKEEQVAKEKAEREAKEKAEAEAKEQAEREAKAKSEAEAEAAAESKRLVEEQERKSAEATKAKAETESTKAGLAIDTSKASKDSQQSRAAADVERMAREASSVPPTPSATEPRTPGVPSTPRTPGTPGFGSLPAKPLSSMPGPAASTSGSTMKLSSDSLERRKRPQPDALDLSAAVKAANDAPLSAATSALNSAKFIDNINSVLYPSAILSPKPELNENAEPRKFRYDRDFLMQFMNVFTDAPSDLPPLSQIGMEAGRQGQGRSGMGPPAAGRGFGNSGSSFGAKGMGAFPHKTTSEERFAIARAGGSSGSGGHFANAPMGSFNAGARSHPISRAGSGSNAIPSRDLMGTGTPAGRTKSNRGRQRDPNQGGGGGGRSGSQFNPPEKGGPTIPLDQVAPLANSENRWQPQLAQRGGATAVKPDSPEMVQRKVKSLLNKLTLEKFDSISDQIVEYGNKSISENDGRTLRQVIKLVFEKATDEAAWSSMYAQLSLKLQANVSDEVRDEGLRTADDKPVSGGLLFRKYLLNRCQEDYERGWAARETSAAAAKSKEAEDRAKKETNEKAEAEAKEAEQRGESQKEREGELLSDEYYEAQKIKRRGLGLVRFVGELFKLGMLSERIMHRCVIGLLSNVSDPEEEDVESLCKLLGTVGALMEARAKPHVDVYFQRINEMVSTPALPSRMKFMLQDLIELRQRDWVQRDGAKDTGPKTIAQIHQDAAAAKARADMEAAASRSHGSRGGPMSRGGSRRGQVRDGYGQEGPDGFRVVGNAPPPAKPRGAGDLSHWGKIDRSSANRPTSFKPAGNSFFGKNKKVSEDGSNPPTRTNSMQNMFQALDSAESEEPAQRKPLNLAPRSKPVDAEKGEGDVDAEVDAAGEGAGEADEDDTPAASEELSKEQVERKIKNDVNEFKEIKDLTEGVLSIKALPPSHRSEFVRAISADAIEGKEDLARLVASLFARLREEEVLDEDTSVNGLQSVLEFLDDSSIDAPNAYKFMAIMLNALNLSEESFDRATSTMQGEGIKTPKERLQAKMADLKE